MTSTIRASSYEWLHQQAGHKTAPDQSARSSNRRLQRGSHPHKTFEFGQSLMSATANIAAVRSALRLGQERPFVQQIGRPCLRGLAARHPSPWPLPHISTSLYDGAHLARLATTDELMQKRQMETNFSRVLRWLIWPVGVIFAFNLQDWASRHGYGTILTDIFKPDGALGDLSSALVDPTVTHFSAFIAGGVLFSALNHWFEMLEYRHGGPPPWLLRNHIALARDALKRRKKRHASHTIPELCEKANRALLQFDLFPIDIPEVVENDEIRVAYFEYLKSVYLLLDGKLAVQARLLADDAEKHITRLIDKGRQVG